MARHARTLQPIPEYPSLEYCERQNADSCACCLGKGESASEDLAVEENVGGAVDARRRRIKGRRGSSANRRVHLAAWALCAQIALAAARDALAQDPPKRTEPLVQRAQKLADAKARASCSAAYNNYLDGIRDTSRKAGDWFLTFARRFVDHCPPFETEQGIWLSSLLARSHLELGDSASAEASFRRIFKLVPRSAQDSMQFQLAAYFVAERLSARAQFDSASALWWHSGFMFVVGVQPELQTARALRVRIANPSPSTGGSSSRPGPLSSVLGAFRLNLAIHRIQSASAVVQQLLPRGMRLDVSAEYCGMAKYSYDPVRRTIILCYEMADYVREMAEWGVNELLQADSSLVGPSDVEKATEGFLVFAILHEVGHAVIHQLRIPALGNEEDVADGFATYALVAAGWEGAAADAAQWLSLLEGRSIADRLERWRDYQEAHPFPGQRYARMLCLLTGKRGAGAASDANERRCREDWQRLSLSWRQLLSQRP